MASKKRPSGKNTTPRKAVQIPVAWLKVAQERARQTKRPTLWHIIDLLKADAEAAGISEIPAAPWEMSPDAE